MPFTVSHIAAVLPLHKPLRRLGLISAAAVGAMAPDLDLLLPIRLTRPQTHGRLALLAFCLPLGLAAWAVFQALIKPALIEVLPDGVYARLCQEHLGPRLGNIKTWLYAALAVVFGALTHIIWDAFTHEDGLGVRMLPILGEPGPELGGSTWTLYRWLQHGSSVLGMAAVLASILLWVRHAKRPSRAPERRLSARERHRWVAVFLFLSVLPTAVAVAHLHRMGWPRIDSTAALMALAVVGIRAIALALVFTGALVRRRLLLIEQSPNQMLER